MAAGSPQHVTQEGHCRYITWIYIIIYPGLPEKELLCGRGGMCYAHIALPSRGATSVMQRRGTFHQREMWRRAGSSAWISGHPKEQRAQQHKALLCLQGVQEKE